MRSRSGLTHETLDQLRAVEKFGGNMRKAYTQPSPADGTTGLRIYDLKNTAIRLAPVTSILRNRISRRASDGSTGLHWKAITGINTGNILPGVSEGNRNAPIAQTTAEYFQGFAGLGMENYSTYEAQYAMKGFANPRALQRLDTLESLINGEERVLLGGNNSLAFGIPGTPSGTIVATGGALTAQAWAIYVVALSFEGILLASVAGGVSTTFVRTNADGSTDTVAGGSSNKSLQSAGVTSAGANSILWVWPSVPGAAGYAVYAGLVGSGAAGATLAAIVTVNEFLQTVNPAGTQNASVVTADNSRNTLVFDGIVTQIAKAASATGAYVKSINGAGLTVDTSGVVVEFEALFEQMWNTSRTGPTSLLTAASTARHLTKKVMAQGGGTPNINITVQIGAGGIKTGVQVESVLNPYTGQFVPLEVHPFMPKGMIVGMSERLPYAIPGVNSGSLLEVVTRQEYYSIDWPARTRKDENGVYVDEGLIMWVPATFSLLQDIDVDA